MYGTGTQLSTAVLHQEMEQQHHPQIAGKEEDNDDSVAGGEDSIDEASPHVHFEPHSHSQALHNVSMEAAAPMNGVDVVSPRALYAPGGSEIVAAPAAGGGADQLTLSFQGEVYVFDAVSPEKVSALWSVYTAVSCIQALLLLVLFGLCKFVAFELRLNK